MIRKLLRNIRHYGQPNLKEVNGLLNLAVLAFGYFNLFLGAALFTQSASTSDFFIITDFFSYQFWGIAFFLGGVSLIVGHILNYWTMMRQTLVYLLFSKFIWLAALMYRQYQQFDSNLFLLLFFALVTVLQVGVYIYFPIYNKVSTWKE